MREPIDARYGPESAGQGGRQQFEVGDVGSRAELKPAPTNFVVAARELVTLRFAAEQGFVDGEHVVHHFWGGEFLVDALAGGAADLQGDFGIAEDGGERIGERSVVVEFGEKATAAVLDDFGEGAGAKATDGIA